MSVRRGRTVPRGSFSIHDPQESDQVGIRLLPYLHAVREFDENCTVNRSGEYRSEEDVCERPTAKVSEQPGADNLRKPRKNPSAAGWENTLRGVKRQSRKRQH